METETERHRLQEYADLPVAAGHGKGSSLAAGLAASAAATVPRTPAVSATWLT